MDETTRRIADMLNEVAAGAPASGRLPTRLRRRARFAMVRTAVGAALAVTIFATGALAAYGSLRDHGAAFSEAATPPPANPIVYVSDRDGDAELYSTDASGSNSTKLTDNAAADTSPSWSPDASQIVFSSDRDGEAGIYVMDADGSNVERLLGHGYHPDWSPDGSAIAFDRAPEPGSLSQIFVLEIPSGVVTQVTDDDAGATDPSWSPDGARIAYMGDQGRIVVADRNGENATRVTDPYGDRHPVWSPEGSTLLFGRETSFVNDVSLANVFSTGASGDGAAHALTDLHGRSVVPEAFSPDGSRVLVTVYEGADGDVYVMSADGSSLAPLIQGQGDDSSADWGPAA